MNTATSLCSEPESISRSMKAGVLWVAALTILRDFVQFGSMLILVRLLEPKAYGQFGLVTSIIGFFTFISYRCVSEHMLQARPHEAIDYQTQFTSAGVIQSVLFVAVNLAPLVSVMSFLLLLDWANEFRFKMLEKTMDWKRLRLLEAAGFILNVIAALLLAFSGFGVYALLVPSLVATLPFLYDLFFVAKWRPDWSFNWNYFREAARYGLARAGSGAVVFGRQLLESATLVQSIGYAQYGIYGRAIGLANVCCWKTTSLITPLLYPVLTRMEVGTAAYRRANELVFRAITWTILPIAVLASIISAPAVKILYGPRWEAAIPLLPLALASAALAGILQTMSLMLLACCQQRRCLLSDVFVMCGTALSLLFLLRRGVADYLTGIVIVQTVSSLLMLYWLIADRILGRRTLWTALIAPTSAAFAAALLGHGLTPNMTVDALKAPDLAVVVVLFPILYLVLLRIILPGCLSELLAYCPGGKVFRRALHLTA
jgi:O-antigen/teichoic acid export membrane protein